MRPHNFWDLFERGEVYVVRGELAVLTGYRETTDEALFEDEHGRKIVCGRGLIRLVN